MRNVFWAKSFVFLCLLCTSGGLVSCGYIVESIRDTQSQVPILSPVTLGDAAQVLPINVTSYPISWFSAGPQYSYIVEVVEGAVCEGPVLASREQKGTSYIISGMENGKRYSVRMKSRAGSTVSEPACSPTFLVDLVVPQVVWGISSAQTILTPSLSLSWVGSDVGSGLRAEATYSISVYAGANCTGSALSSTTSTSSEFNLTGLLVGDVRSVNLISYDAAQNSSSAACSPAIQRDSGTPVSQAILGVRNAATDTTLDNVLQGSLIPVVEWTPFANATNYEVTIRDSTGLTDICGPINVSSTVGAFTGACNLVSGSQYRIVVEGISVTGLRALASNNLFLFSADSGSLGIFSITGITGGTDTIADSWLNNGLAPRVNFSPSTGAASYEARILSGTTVLCTATGATSPIDLSAAGCGLAQDQNYNVEVGARTTAGFVIRNSSNTPFAFVVDDNIPVVTFRTASQYAFDRNEVPSSYEGWLYRQKITINNNGFSEDLTNFPIMVALNSSRVSYADFQPSGADLRFTDVAGNVLSYEIESWNSSGTSVAWVKVPIVKAGSTQNWFWMYYGRAGAPDAQAAGAVWSNGYSAVYHMNSGADSLNLRNSTATATVSTAGLYSSALQFGGAARLDLPDSFLGQMVNQPKTLETFFRVTQPNSPLLATTSVSPPTAPANFIPSMYINNSGQLTIAAWTNATTSLVSPQLLIGSGWQHAAMAFTTNQFSGYLNGTSFGTVPAVQVASADIKGFIGYGYGNTWPDLISGWQGFKGDIDEVRISDVTRSKQWLSATNLSLRDQLLSFSARESSQLETNQIWVDLDRAPAVDVTIPYTVAGITPQPAINPDDHNLVGSTLTIPTGQTSGVISFATRYNSLVTGDKYFRSTMGAIGFGAKGSPSTNDVRILFNTNIPVITAVKSFALPYSQFTESPDFQISVAGGGATITGVEYRLWHQEGGASITAWAPVPVVQPFRVSSLSLVAGNNYLLQARVVDNLGHIGKVQDVSTWRVTSGATQLSFITTSSSNGIAGVAITPGLSIQMQDVQGDRDFDRTDNIVLTAFSDADCSIPLTGTTLAGDSATAVGGAASFNSLSGTRAATYYFRATAAGLSTACSDGVLIRANVPATVTADGSATLTQNFCSLYILRLWDVYGNATSFAANTTTTLAPTNAQFRFWNTYVCSPGAVTSQTFNANAQSMGVYLMANSTSAVSATVTVGSLPAISINATVVSPIPSRLLLQPDWTTDLNFSKGYTSQIFSVASDGTRLFVARRSGGVLGWSSTSISGYSAIPTTNHAVHDFVYGALGPNLPSGSGLDGRHLINLDSTDGSGAGSAQIHFADNRLFVADPSGSRILIKNAPPSSSAIAFDRVLGQTGLVWPNMSPNRGLAGPTAETLSRPQGVFYDGTRLYVADSDNHRVLIWNSLPTTDGQPADIVLGQPDFTSNLANQGGAASASTLNFPHTLFVTGTKLIVSDYSNHRVLVWNTIPTTNNEAASQVLGQSDFSTTTCPAPTANSLCRPSGLWSDGTQLLVGSRMHGRISRFATFPVGNGGPATNVIGRTSLTQGTGATAAHLAAEISSLTVVGGKLIASDIHFNRVTIWNAIPTTDGVAADVVLGQPNFVTQGSDHSGMGLSRVSSAGALFVQGTQLFVADPSSGRVLVWNTLPTADDTAADFVIGKPNGDYGAHDFTTSDTNLRRPTSISSNGTQLAIADQVAHRVLIYNAIPNASGAAANIVLGQTSMTASGANTPSRSASTMNSPGSVALLTNKLLVVDNNNSRVLIWNSIPTTNGQPADLVLGQPNFTANDNTTVVGMRENNFSCPGHLWTNGTKLIVTDQCAARALVWNSFPTTNNQNADFVMESSSFFSDTCGTFWSCDLWNPQVLTSDGNEIWITGYEGGVKVFKWPDRNATPWIRFFGTTIQNGCLYTSLTSEWTCQAGGMQIFGGKFYLTSSQHRRVMIYDTPP